jgi:hypothetical protein
LLTADQLVSMAANVRQEKNRSRNPFIELNPMIYKKLLYVNGATYMNPTIDSANLGRSGLRESFLVEGGPRKEKDLMLDYLLRNGLVSAGDYTLAKRVLQNPLEAARIEQLRVVLVRIFNKFMKFVINDPQNYIRSRMMLTKNSSKKYGIREDTVNDIYEICKPKKKSNKLNIINPRDREMGTPSLTAIYRSMTPGQ